MADAPLTPVPAHVPDHLVREFDCYDLQGDAEDPQLAWKRVQDTSPPIFWTPFNGGHWVLTRAKDIEAVFRDHDRFSTSNFLVPKMVRKPRALPQSADPPEHIHFKRLITPSFSPGATQGLIEIARTATMETVARLAPRGGCEFIDEVATVVTNAVGAALFGSDTEETRTIRALSDGIVRSSDPGAREMSVNQMAAHIRRRLDEAVAAPGDDVFSLVANAQIDGRPITDDEAMGLAVVLMTAPLENTTNVLGFVMYYLARHPELQRRLADDPSTLPHAVEELLRRNGVAATSREVREDVDVAGVRVLAGDMVQVPSILVGFETRCPADPMNVDWHREERPEHAVFGMGIHKCAGAYLVRQELRVFLEEWLSLVPEFSAVPDKRPEMGAGHVFTMRSLHLRWSPDAPPLLARGRARR